MKREEAIDTLKAIKALMKIYPKRKKQKEAITQLTTALDMAIESLQTDVNPPVIRSKTLMSREGFEEWTKRMKEINPNAIVIPCDAECVTEQKHGKWLHKPSRSGADVWWQCSECGAVIYSESDFDREYHHTFCGVCGARMDGRNESDVVPIKEVKCNEFKIDDPKGFVADEWYRINFGGTDD